MYAPPALPLSNPLACSSSLPQLCSGSAEVCVANRNTAAFSFYPPNNNSFQGVASYSASLSCPFFGANGIPNVASQVSSGSNALPQAFSRTSYPAVATNTFSWPNAAGATLSPGVYQFQFNAESVCGTIASAPITIAVRCPPSPNACARVLDTSSAPLPIASGAYTLPVFDAFILDSSPSAAHNFILPGAGAQSSYTITSLAWGTSANASAFEFVAPQTLTSCGANPAPGCGCGASADGLCRTRWGRILVPGTFNFTLTVGDGCSTAATSFLVTATCSCPPVALTRPALPTLWSDVPTDASATRLTNIFPTVPPPSLSLTDLQGSNQFVLDGTDSIDLDTNATSLSFDWDLVGWIPSLGFSYGAQQSFSAFSRLSPPSSGAACVTSAGAGAAGVSCFAEGDYTSNPTRLTGPNNYK